MNKYINKIQRFMIGRNGTDELYKFLIILCFVLILINSFLESIILSTFELFIFFVSVFRVLSKNIYRRRKENEVYLNFKKRIVMFIDYRKNIIRDRNTHIYKKCPKCKQKIRLPLKKGRHNVVCPSCKEKFEVKCRRNEKIIVEVVK